MAAEVQRLFNETDVQEQKIFAMGGHEDGVIAFGTSAEEAGDILLRTLDASRKNRPRIIVIPAQAGIQSFQQVLDAGLRRSDEIWTFYGFIIIDKRLFLRLRVEASAAD